MEINTGEEKKEPSYTEESKQVETGVSSNKTETSKNTAAVSSPPRRIRAAPHTRRIAREMGVNIEKIDGTGPSGRVIDDDVYRFAQGGDSVNDTFPDSDAAVNSTSQEKESVPLTGVRKQIAKKMSDSWNTIPHVTHFDEADITNLLNFRDELKQSDETISVTSFFIKAIVISLQDYKVFNARLDEENEMIELFKSCHIGFAADTKEGVMVPAIQNADKKTIKTINKEMKALTEKAQEGNLSPSDMKNSTFTVNNVGPLGGTAATPIINKPHTGIISFHKTKKKPAVIENDEIAIRSIMTISFSFDHRVADGARAIEFINRFIDLIENPKKLFLELA
ncbi:2-oxo acid dehydrogenase subunit E2 [Lentibacillus halophilus]|uniref:2-oxo acid dehydrogenase subunit E2 n=2 Tax=Lentibacillus halophilus TaxID=295065 RepID=A0ABP3J3G7_9BACI